MQRVEDEVAKNCSLVWLLRWWPRFYYLQQEKQTKSYSIKSSLSTTKKKKSSKDGCFYILSIGPSQSSNESIWEVSTVFTSLFFASIVVCPALALILTFPVTVLRDFFGIRECFAAVKCHLCFFRCLNSCNQVFLTPSFLLFFLPIASTCRSTIRFICV